MSSTATRCRTVRCVDIKVASSGGTLYSTLTSTTGGSSRASNIVRSSFASSSLQFRLTLALTVCDLDYDPFVFMRDNKKKYGFNLR